MLTEKLLRVVFICVTLVFVGILINGVYIMRHKREIVYSPFEMKTPEPQLDKLMNKMEMMHATLNDIWKQTNLMDKRPPDKREPDKKTKDVSETKIEAKKPVKQEDINPIPNTAFIRNERKFVKMKFGHLYIFGAATGNSSIEKTFDLVKIYGNFEKKSFAKSSFYCCFKYNNGAEKSIIRVTPLVKRKFQSAADMWSYYLACPNTNNLSELNRTLFGDKAVVVGHSNESQTTPPLKPDDISAIDTNTLSEVAVTADNFSCEEKDVTYFKPFRPLITPGKIAIGTKTAFGGINPEQIIEWMETYKYIGVDKVVTYYVKILNADALKVLKYYESTGFLDLTFYEPAAEETYPRLPVFATKHNQRWNDQQVVVDDSFERMSGYQYFGIIDHDEFFIPSNNRTLKHVLDTLSEVYPKASGYSLSSQYYHLSWGRSSNQTDMFLGSYTQREERAPRHDNVKNIYTPSRVALGKVDTHVIQSAKGFKMHSIPPEMGYIRHFRACREAKLKQCMNETETPRVVDTEIAEWSTKIAANVANVRKKVLGI